MQNYKNYVKTCFMCPDYNDEVFKDKTQYSDASSESNAPDSVNPAGRTSSIITRSMSRKIEKNKLLKKVFCHNINRYPLRSRHKSLELRPNYYESEDSDADIKLRRKMLKRRHSVGSVWGNENEKRKDYDTEKLDNQRDSLFKKKVVRRFSETLGLASEKTFRLSSEDCDDINKKKCVQPEVNPKTICITCHLRKLINAAENKPSDDKIESNVQKVVPKKLNQRRKSTPNYYMKDKKFNENNTGNNGEKMAPQKLRERRKSASQISHVKDKESMNVLTNKISQNETEHNYLKREPKKLYQRRKSESNLYHIKENESNDIYNRTKTDKIFQSLEYLPREKTQYKTLLDGREKSTQTSITAVETKKIFQKRKSENTVFIKDKYSETSDGKKQSKDVDKRGRSTERRSDKQSTSNSSRKESSQKRKSNEKREEFHHKSEGKKHSKDDKKEERNEKPITKLEPKKILQRTMLDPASYVREVKTSEKADTKKRSNNKDERERSTEKLKTSSLSRTSHKRKSEDAVSCAGEKYCEKPNAIKDKHRKSTEKRSATKEDSKQTSQKRCSESRVSDLEDKGNSSKITSLEIKKCTKSDKRAKSCDRVTNSGSRKITEKTSGSGTSHKSPPAISKNADMKNQAKVEALHSDRKQKSNERPSTSGEHKTGNTERCNNKHFECGPHETCITSKSKLITQSKKSESDSYKVKKYSKNSEPNSHSKQEHCQKRAKSDEKSIENLDSKKTSQIRNSEGGTSQVKEKDHSKDTKKSSEKKGALHVARESIKVTKCESCEKEKTYKVDKGESNAHGKKRPVSGDKMATSVERLTKSLKQSKSAHSESKALCLDKKDKDLTSEPKRVSFARMSIDTPKPVLKKIANRRKSDTATHSNLHNNELSEYKPPKKQIKEMPSQLHSNQVSQNDTVVPKCLRGKRKFLLNFSSDEIAENAHGAKNKLSESVISIHSIVSSDEEMSQSGADFMTPEDLLREMFHDKTELECAREELIRILATSTESLDAESDRSLLHDMLNSCKESLGEGISNQVIIVVDSCEKDLEHNLSNAENKPEDGDIVISERHDTDSDQISEIGSDNAKSDMTKMEHYKKRLIQQHEKPRAIVSPTPTSEEEDNSPSQSPINPSQNSSQEKKKEEIVHSKVARKRAVCRSKFRHQNLEIFKLGTSVSTSLCKTKEPYNVCKGKNLQACHQNQKGKKYEENAIKESITESIINSMEGNKRKDILWRSISANNEKSEKQVSSNNVENNRNGSGRHILPAIIPEIQDWRKIKTSNTGENKTAISGKVEQVKKKVENNLVIHKADPVKINTKKAFLKRRKTVIGIEGSDTDVRNINEESVSDAPNQSTNPVSNLTRRKSTSTESEISENSPINLSLKNTEQNAVRVQVSNAYSDPRLYTKRSQYLEQILRKNYSTPEKPPSSSLQNQEPVRDVAQITSPTASPENHEFAYVTGPTKPAAISSQNHEPARNYVAGLSRSPSSGSSASSARQNQERTTNYVAGLSRSPSSGSSASSARQNQERATNYSARPSEPPVSLSKNYEPARNIAGASKNHEPSRIYFPGQRTSINGPVPYYQNNYLGTSFPEIQEQMIRLENPNAPLRPQNHLIAPRKEKIIHSESYLHRPANPSLTNNEDVIKTIIQFVKSSMNQNFSIEILLTLSKWHIELKSYHIQPTVSKKLKTAITRTLNDIVLYISDNLFGVPCNLLLKSYVEQIIQVVASHHKELLTSLLPWFRINHNNDQWMSNIIKLLSQSQPSLPSDPRNQVNSEHNRGPVIHNHPNRMYSVPVSNHTYPHHNIAPQNYYFQNYHAPPQPFQGYHYQPNPLRENYMSNMEHRRNEMLLPYPVNHLDPAIERQRDQQNMQVLYGNASQNFPMPENCNILVTPITPNMYLADNRCVPPKYGPNPNLEKQGLQTKVGRYKSINKDRLDIIPITPATSSSAISVPSNNKTLQGLYLEKATVTNGEKHSHKNTNDQSREMSNANKKQTKDLSIEQNRAYSRQISETSTCSSSVADHCPVSDVEELLPSNFIFNKTRTESSSTVKENSMPNIGVGEESNENAMTNINNPELNEETTINNKNNSNSEDNSVSNTVIVKDNSMEITRGNSNENVSFYELTDNDNLEEVTNDIILERIDMMEESDDDITTMPSSTDDAPKNKVESTDGKLKSELYNLLEEIKEKLQKCASDSPEVKMQIIKEVFGDDFKDEYVSMLHCSVPKKEYKIELKDPNEVITIDDDEDVSIEKVADITEPVDALPRLIKLLPLKRKDGGHSQEHHKKLKTAMPSASSNLNINEIVIIDDEEKDNNTDATTTMKDVHNSDCNQNSVSLIDQNITKNEEVAIDEPKEQPNSGNISAEETASPTPNGLEELSVVTDVVEAADSLIANEQSVLAPETPAIEDISSDEETVENFRLQSCYKNKISCSSDTSLAVMEVSHCTLIKGSVDFIKKSSNREFFEKPLVYTRPVMPRRAGRHSVDSETTTSTLSRCSKEVESGGKTRKWNCLGNITQFEEDTTASSSVISVQPSWDLNYSNPKNTEERDFSLSPAYQVSMKHVSPLASPCFLEDNRYSRVSPITSPTNRFPPNFTSPNRSVPTSPVVPLPSLVSTTSTVNSMSALVLGTSSVVPTTTSVVQTTSVIPEAPTLNNRVNWQNWFTEEKRKGFFDFERSQSVESRSLSRRQSLETVSSVNSDYDNYCEIKIDSKVYRIKRSVYEKIPKGKLCYIRENNTFIRYFDDSQMELFIHNLNISEGSSIASDLLKQIKGRVEGLCDIDTSLGHYEASGKSEVITVSKDVTFSTEDYLSDPELYVEEVEKVQLFVPRDFYGFYKYVTGYQIINHHPPISFQTFLTMHNTNGIRGLFKNYVNTLIEGHTIL